MGGCVRIISVCFRLCLHLCGTHEGNLPVYCVQQCPSHLVQLVHVQPATYMYLKTT